MLCVIWCMLSEARCLPFVVCCLLRVARCLLCVVGCLLIASVVRCVFAVVCWLSYDACRWWLRVVFLLFVECWLLVGVCLLRAVRLSRVTIVCWGVACCVMDVRRVLFAVCLSLCVVCSLLCVGCRSLLCCLILVV